MIRALVMHGINLDTLGRRPAEHYGTTTLPELEARITAWGEEIDVEVSCFQTNHEGTFCEALHGAPARADGLVLNPGAWTHYSWAIHDALEVASLPTVEVHLSAIDDREAFRRVSVLDGLCVGSVRGKGVEGYREALEILRERVGS